MKKSTIFIFTIITLFLIFSNPGCKDKEAKPIGTEKYSENNNDTIWPWYLHFYFTDSLGSNMAPCDLTDSSFLNPDDFYVISDSATSLFFYKYIKSQNDSACVYSFQFGERLQFIRSSSQYQIDSTYKVKVCFANECDTVISRVYSHEEQDKIPSNGGRIHCGTKWVLWEGKDTIFSPSCSPIPIIIK